MLWRVAGYAGADCSTTNLNSAIDLSTDGSFRFNFVMDNATQTLKVQFIVTKAVFERSYVGLGEWGRLMVWSPATRALA